jgi:hypothetical protein
LIRLAGMLLIEQTDEWLVARRHLSQESLTALKHGQTELSDLTELALDDYQARSKRQQPGGELRPRRLRAPTTFTDDHELHHESLLDSRSGAFDAREAVGRGERTLDDIAMK